MIILLSSCFRESVCEQALSPMSKSATSIDTDVIQEIVTYSLMIRKLV